MRFLMCFLFSGAVLLSGCSLTGSACGNGFNATTGVVGDFGVTSAALQLEALLVATVELDEAASAVESDLLTVCTDLADDLEIASADRQPVGTETPVGAICRAVATEISSILSETLPTDVGLSVITTPGVCEVQVEAAATCAAECDVAIEADAAATCTGDLVGSCSGTCTGECTVDASAACEGVCSGACSGSCTGICYGTCSGTCSKMGSDGSCAGTCTGTCEGSCTATCTGSCDAKCTADVAASCTGSCRGECSAEWMASCDGYVEIDADVDCEAACSAEASATAVCRDPEVSVAVEVVGNTDAQARLDRLLFALDANWDGFLKIQNRLNGTLVPALAAFGTAVNGAASAVGAAGTRAVACSIEASVVALNAIASIEASATITVNVSASVTVQGG